jgi:hypothetical protein
MATSFKPADVVAGTTRVLLYTCPGATQAVAFSGTATNIDDATLQEHWISLEVQKVDTSYIKVLNKIAVPYGNSLTIPKVALAAGEKLYVTSDAANAIQTRFSIVEKV